MKKILIITYYWPPSGGPGVQRVLKLVKYLPEFGWQPIVLTVENGNYPSIDNTLLKEIPIGCNVYKTKSFEPFELYKTFTGKKSNEKIPTFVLNKGENENFTEKVSKWLRANIFVPDAKIGWINGIVRDGLRIVENEKPDLIFSSSPPHSLQIGAMRLAKKTGLKWIADFRDPWSNAFWQKDINRMSIAAKRDLKFEHRVLSAADHITTVSNSVVNLFKGIVNNNYSVLYNGFDESDFIQKKQKKDKFVISYTGTLGQSQIIDNFIKAVSELNNEIKQKIEINFYGSFHPSVKFLLNSVKEINIYPNVPHEKAVEIMLNSDILLLVIPNSSNNKGIVTGKIFEYMATKNFILGIGPIDGDASEILHRTNTGKIFSYKHDLKPIITEQFYRWQNDEELIINQIEVSKFSRKKTAEQFACIFEELT